MNICVIIVMDPTLFDSAEKIMKQGGGHIDKNRLKQAMHQSVTDSTTQHLTPKERLRAKIGRFKQNRLTSNAGTFLAEKKDALVKKKNDDEKRRKHYKKQRQRKKIKELERKLGLISDEMYMEVLKKTNREDYQKITKEHVKCSDKNVILLYEKQHKYDTKIDMSDGLSE